MLVSPLAAASLAAAAWLAPGTSLAAPASAAAAPERHTLDAPNVVVIGERLVTAGQPTRAALAGLGAMGIEAVVYLVPDGAADAVPDERALLARQGIEFVHIPIPFDAPAAAHLDALVAALDRLQGRRVLVHCQLNLRASTMVFLVRAVARREDPDMAYDAVTRVWTPRGPWRDLVAGQLRRHGVDFEPE